VYSHCARRRATSRCETSHGVARRAERRRDSQDVIIVMYANYMKTSQHKMTDDVCDDAVFAAASLFNMFDSSEFDGDSESRRKRVRRCTSFLSGVMSTLRW
jgi:hypothetical protein